MNSGEKDIALAIVSRPACTTSSRGLFQAVVDQGSAEGGWLLEAPLRLWLGVSILSRIN